MSTGGPTGGGFWGGMGPSGRYGVWPTCGCSSLLMIIAGIILVCAGGMRLFEGMIPQ